MGAQSYIYVFFLVFRPTNNDQYAPKEFSIMGSEATSRTTPSSFFLHPLPVLPALYYSPESLRRETSYGFPVLMVLMLFLKETKRLQLRDLGPGSRSWESSDAGLRTGGLRLRYSLHRHLAPEVCLRGAGR